MSVYEVSVLIVKRVTDDDYDEIVAKDLFSLYPKHFADDDHHSP